MKLPIDLKALWSFAQREVGLTAVLLGVALPLLIFAGIADEVSEGDARGFDTAIMLAMRTGDHHDPIGPAWFETGIADITALGGFGVLALVTVTATGFLLITRKYSEALLLVVAIVGGTLLSESLKSGFSRPRPDLVAHVVQVTSASFPSGHAMLSAISYLTIGALLARTRESEREKTYIMSTAVLVTLLIGVSRVYLGVHWPTDVLAGWCLGAAWAMLCWSVVYWFERRQGAKR